MPDEANIDGWEWMLQCECKGVILHQGMSYMGPPPDYERDIARHEGEKPITDGNEYECRWCGRKYRVSIEEIEGPDNESD